VNNNSPYRRQQLENRICTVEQLRRKLHLRPEEKQFFSATTGDVQSAKAPPFCVTPYYLDLAMGPGGDPIRRQCIPTMHELDYRPYEEQDPLCEDRYSPLPRLVHRYADRVLVLVTGVCAVYCRHCFRRYFAGSPRPNLNADEIDRMAAYVAERSEIEEAIFSGGDPLMLADEQVDDLLTRFRLRDRSLRIRIATRVPVVLPQRITDDLTILLRKFAPLWMVVQFNHPREISEQSREAIGKLVDMGIPILNQTVLLKGVNDSAATLAELFRSLLNIRVKPYYLFQGDLACGTSHLRVPMDKGFEIMRTLRSKLSGAAIPTYAVDLPGGGGKIALTESSVHSQKEGWYYFKDSEGRLFRYPQE
jgi:lysine 2,3-aminomutase